MERSLAVTGRGGRLAGDQAVPLGLGGGLILDQQRNSQSR